VILHAKYTKRRLNGFNAYVSKGGSHAMEQLTAEALLGLGRIVASRHRPSAFDHIC
jgi:hypothetical protein